MANDSHVAPLRARLAAAPISWGVCEVPGWGFQLDAATVLRDMADMGFTLTETGPVGFLPTEPAAMAATLAERGLRALSGFVPLVMHRPECYDDTMRRAEATMAAIAASGGSYYVSCAVSSYEAWERPTLSDGEWAHLYRVLDELQAMAPTHGLTQGFHSHVDAIVETDAEVRGVLANSAATLTLDTAHLTVGGTDPVALCAEFADRIALVHLKDVDPDVLARYAAGDVSFMEAVQQSIFPPLGQGCVDVAKVIELAEAAAPGRSYVLEQDAALGDGEPETVNRLRGSIRASLDYVDGLRLPAASAPASPTSSPQTTT